MCFIRDLILKWDPIDLMNTHMQLSDPSSGVTRQITGLIGLWWMVACGTVIPCISAMIQTILPRRRLDQQPPQPRPVNQFQNRRVCLNPLTYAGVAGLAKRLPAQLARKSGSKGQLRKHTYVDNQSHGDPKKPCMPCYLRSGKATCMDTSHRSNCRNPCPWLLMPTGDM